MILDQYYHTIRRSETNTYFQGAVRADATVRELRAHLGGTETGQTDVDHMVADREHGDHNHVRRVRGARQPGPGYRRAVRADGAVLGDHVLRRHGHVDDTMDSGQRDLPERVSLGRTSINSFKFQKR